jgi:hypothetical protein
VVIAAMFSMVCVSKPASLAGPGTVITAAHVYHLNAGAPELKRRRSLMTIGCLSPINSHNHPAGNG